MANRRRSERFEVALPIWLKDGHGGERTTTTNVSSHGLAVVSPKARPLRQYIEIEIALPEPRANITVTAVVARHAAFVESSSGAHSSGLGLDFFLFDARAKSSWQDFLKKLRTEGTDFVPAAPATAAADDVPSGPRALPERAYLPRDAEPPEPPEPEEDAPTFIIKPRDLGRLWAFFRGELAKGRVRIETPIGKPNGAAVELLVVHPSSQAEWTLDGVVADTRKQSRANRPVLEINLVDLTPELRTAFRNFVATGRGMIEEDIEMVDEPSQIRSEPPRLESVVIDLDSLDDDGDELLPSGIIEAPHRFTTPAPEAASGLVDADPVPAHEIAARGGVAVGGVVPLAEDRPEPSTHEPTTPAVRITPTPPKVPAATNMAITPLAAQPVPSDFYLRGPATSSAFTPLPSPAPRREAAPTPPLPTPPPATPPRAPPPMRAPPPPRAPTPTPALSAPAAKNVFASFFEEAAESKPPAPAGLTAVNSPVERPASAPRPPIVTLGRVQLAALRGGDAPDDLAFDEEHTSPERPPPQETEKPAPAALPPHQSTRAPPRPPLQAPSTLRNGPKPSRDESNKIRVGPAARGISDVASVVRLPSSAIVSKAPSPSAAPSPELPDWVVPRAAALSPPSTPSGDEFRVVRGAPSGSSGRSPGQHPMPAKMPPPPAPGQPSPYARVPSRAMYDLEAGDASMGVMGLDHDESEDNELPVKAAPVARPKPPPLPPSARRAAIRNPVEREHQAHRNLSTQSVDPDLDRDIGLARARVVRSPHSVTACYRLSMLLMRRNEDVGVDEALESLKKVMTLEPNHPGAHHKIAELLARRGDYGLAREHLGRARRLGYRIDPDLERIVTEGAKG